MIGRRRTHFLRLTQDEQRLVRTVQPHPSHSTPRTRRYMRASCGGWSEGKFYNVQRSLIDKGWDVKPFGEFAVVRGQQRPLYKVLQTEEDYLRCAEFERRYTSSRTQTGMAVQARGEVDNRTSVPIHDEQHRLTVANNVVKGEPTAVPIGQSANDPELKQVNNGDEVLTEQELARLLAPMLKQHPDNR
jgi:hypothetical protein